MERGVRPFSSHSISFGNFVVFLSADSRGFDRKYIVIGKVAILFMWREKQPDKAWLTIEMNGNSLVQIHGYRNEGMYSAKGRIADDPRIVHREFLDTWLDWLKKGSKRDKDGNPKLPRKKKEGAAA